MKVVKNKTDNSEQFSKDQIIIKPTTFSVNAERKTKIEQTIKASENDSTEITSVKPTKIKLLFFAKPENLETWPNHLSFRFLAAWIFLCTSSLVTWSL